MRYTESAPRSLTSPLSPLGSCVKPLCAPSAPALTAAVSPHVGVCRWPSETGPGELCHRSQSLSCTASSGARRSAAVLPSSPQNRRAPSLSALYRQGVTRPGRAQRGTAPYPSGLGESLSGPVQPELFTSCAGQSFSFFLCWSEKQMKHLSENRKVKEKNND